jgi:DNA-binding response OmpR family regulator
MKRGIVFIDDSPMTRDLAAMALSDAGYEVQTCVDADTMLRAVQTRGSFLAAVIIDTHLPGVDVPRLVAELRAAAPDTPLVFLLDSGPLSPDTHLAQQYSAHTLAKPFTPRELLLVMKSALSESIRV